MTARSYIEVAQVETAGEDFIGSQQIVGYRQGFLPTEGLKLFHRFVSFSLTVRIAP